MKKRHLALIGLAIFGGVASTMSYAKLTQDSWYDYYDPDGSWVGSKYVSCWGQRTIEGRTTDSYTVFHTSCYDSTPDPGAPTLPWGATP